MIEGNDSIGNNNSSTANIVDISCKNNIISELNKELINNFGSQEDLNEGI